VKLSLIFPFKNFSCYSKKSIYNLWNLDGGYTVFFVQTAAAKTELAKSFASKVENGQPVFKINKCGKESTLIHKHSFEGLEQIHQPFCESTPFSGGEGGAVGFFKRLHWGSPFYLYCRQCTRDVFKIKKCGKESSQWVDSFKPYS